MSPLRLLDYVEQVQSLIHDSTGSAWTRREIIARINDARKDVSLDMQCVRSLVTGAQLIEGVETYSFDGAVCGAHVVNRGSGYGGRRAAVSFGPPAAGGVQAEGFALVKQAEPNEAESPFDPDDDDEEDADRVLPGQIERIVMRVWGKWYTQVPTVTITDPTGSGSGATATAVTLFDVINVMSLTPLWNTQRYSLSYKPFTIFQAWARALQAQGFTSLPQMFTIHPGDQLVYVQPTPNQHFRSEWDVVRLAKPLIGLSDIDRDIPEPHSQAVQYKAAEYLLFKHQNFGQAQYYASRYDQRVPRILAGQNGVRIANPYNRSMFEKMRRA